MTHELPKLGYEYNALEPYIDARTMEIHITKHHGGYVKKLNATLENLSTEIKEMNMTDLMKNIDKMPVNAQTSIRNNGGGHYNHAMFWKLLKKDVAFEGKLADAILAKWNTLEEFKNEFAKAATTQFGSGWAWLSLDTNNELAISSSANQDNPLSENKTPILCLDIWEHAYYLNYQNRRPDYVNAFFNIINWEQAERNYVAAKKE